MSNQSNIANPAPLGLIGFAMTTILLNLHNAGFLPLSIVIVSMGITIGGISQIIAGIMEFLKNNTFGATAFTAYGFFWLSLVIIWINPFSTIEAADSLSLGFYLGLWGLFTVFMFFGTLKHNRTSQFVFGSLTALFLLLAVANFTESSAVHVIAGYVGIFCGLCAFYNAVAQIINQEFGKTIMPL
ncbi:acetate uptake transporter [Eubacteriaceae bacterium ES3]|nr:acetate uptake transporter [Eubacteriaceae bacterium ES3]